MAASTSRPQPDLASRVAAFAATRFPVAGPVAVGFSGGRDSIVLLHALSRLDLGARLSALHVHHGLSPHADAWADFCVTEAAALGVPCTVRRVRVGDTAGQGLEAAARTARYQAFADSGLGLICLAHHRDDQAETVLFNLLRGSGIAGLAGMRDERSQGALRLLRPLLGTGRAEIEAYAAEHGLRWIDDESNDDRRHARNFLRHEVLTVIDGRFPGAARQIARAADWCAEADALLGELAELDWLAVADGDQVRLAGLKALSPARVRNLIRHRLAGLGWQAPDASRLDEFVRQLRSAGPDRHPELALPDGTMRAGRGRLCWLPAV